MARDSVKHIVEDHVSTDGSYELESDEKSLDDTEVTSRTTSVKFSRKNRSRTSTSESIEDTETYIKTTLPSFVFDKEISDEDDDEVHIDDDEDDSESFAESSQVICFSTICDNDIFLHFQVTTFQVESVILRDLSFNYSLGSLAKYVYCFRIFIPSNNVGVSVAEVNRDPRHVNITQVLQLSFKRPPPFLNYGISYPFLWMY